MNSTIVKCKYIITSNTKEVCSIFYHSLSDGNCKLYWISSNAVEFLKNQTFQCKDGSSIPKSMENDLVSDCGPEAEDELHLHYLSYYTEIYTSHNMSQIPCREHHSQCYSISDTCVYKLGKFGYLRPCRTGEHLQNCTKFECNMQFKCPGYYCIRYRYSCDGKWNCPGGYDENSIHGCSSKRKCKNMFKCQNSNICIHVGDICNGIFDCPFMDDEHLCLLQDVVCPPNCECLALAVGCFGVDTLTTNLIHVSPYIVVFLENCSMKFTHNMLQKIGQFNILSVKRNNLISICSFMPSSAAAYLYDIGFNSVSAIDKNCFKNGTKIVKIRLNNNLLEYLHPMAFMNLTSLQYLELSSNNLLDLQYVIFTFTKLKPLLIQNNNFIRIYPGMFNDGKPDLLVTNELGVCCKFYKSVLCTVHIPWYKACSNLFPNIIIKVLSYISFSLVLIANCIHISVDAMLKNTKCRKSVTFGFTVNLICVNNFLYDGYLFIMIISDLFYGKTFPLNQQMWQEDIFCATAFALSLIYSLMSPLLLSYLSMLRFLVIVYPLKFSIKKINVGLRPILFVSLSIILQTIFLTVAVGFSLEMCL